MRARAVVMVPVLAAAWITASPATARVTCLGRAATVVGTARHDVLKGTNGPDVIAGLDGADVILGRGGTDRICGGGGEEYGDDQPEELRGGPGRDLISGGPFYEEMFGGPGNDVLWTNEGGGSSVGEAGDDVLNGGPHADFLGGMFIDYSPLWGFDTPGPDGDDGAQAPGEAGVDRIYGRAAGDYLFVGPGAEVMDGGPGKDMASFYTKRDVDYVADLRTGSAEGQDRDVLRSIENLAAFTRGDVVLRGDDGPNTLAGGPVPGGRGVFHGEGGDDALVPWRAWDMGGRVGELDLYGGEGDDLATSFSVCEDSPDPNVVDGGPGNDDLSPYCGDVLGGDGDDFIGAFHDYQYERTIDGGPGTDIAAWPWSGLYSHLEVDLAAGTAQEVWHEGTRSAVTHVTAIEGVQGTQEQGDVILGDDGPNILWGGVDTWRNETDGPDTIDGRGGDDVIYGDEGDDDLEGGDGIDTIDGQEGFDSCTGAETFLNCESFTVSSRTPARRYARLL